MQYWPNLGLTLLAMAGPAMADCTNPQTQMDMNRCAALDLAKATDGINASYQALMRRLDPGQQAELKAIQRQWISFKDRNCAFDASFVEGGSMQPLVRDACLTALTRERTQQLDTWLKTLGQ